MTMKSDTKMGVNFKCDTALWLSPPTYFNASYFLGPYNPSEKKNRCEEVSQHFVWFLSKIIVKLQSFYTSFKVTPMQYFVN